MLVQLGTASLLPCFVSPLQAAPFLEESSRLFERILDAEDALDGAAVEDILAQVCGFCVVAVVLLLRRRI